ncbi:MAG: nucleotide sugar dehydrogenase [Verrucomicrobiae bacterium]|nr:nucleotide sugar dehydrogenase [Verrucomicrobiae bacterium]
MNVTVLGLWHLGCVTAACSAKHHAVTGLDFDPAVIAKLQSGQAPIFEPGLDELIRAGLRSGSLSFTTDAQAASAQADVLWVCYDTPVNENDEPDTEFVLQNLRRAIQHLPAGRLVLVSSQLPVGTCRTLEAEYPQFQFACAPENLRLGKAIDAFEKPDRIVLGIRSSAQKRALEQLFGPLRAQILFMRTESAEMLKHALNSFLALSISFINEIARLCEAVGADAHEVALGLKTDPRIGQKAYVRPGGPFAGGTLARDVAVLENIANTTREPVQVIPAIRKSNEHHRQWALRKLQARLGPLTGKTVAILGLVYTPGTDTLRRSAAVELCQAILRAGAKVKAFDPAIRTLPAHLAEIQLASNLAEALKSADAAVVCTEWTEFKSADWPELAKLMNTPLVLDPNRFLENSLQHIPNAEHIWVGQPQT